MGAIQAAGVHKGLPGRVRGPETSVCDECRRGPRPLRVRALSSRPPAALDPARCLLAQGVLCCGPATRAGCGAACPAQRSPCIGCFGANGPGGDFPARAAEVLGALLAGPAGDPWQRLAAAGLPAAEARFRQFVRAHQGLRERVQAALIERDLRTDA